jgi:hypothetical protein
MSTRKNIKASAAEKPAPKRNTAKGNAEEQVAESATAPTATATATEEPVELEVPETLVADTEIPVVDTEETNDEKAPEVDERLTGDAEKDRLIVAETEGDQVDESANYVDITSDSCPELHEKLCEAYPHIDHFFLTTDLQVFLPANKQYALDHEKSLKTGNKIGRLKR